MPKHVQLVCQHLERIPRVVLVQIQPIIREYVRGRNGVYALYSGRKLYYVGLARDLKRRLKSHLKNKHANSWDSFSIYLTIGDKHLRELESLVLRIVRPSGNSQLAKFLRSENLQKRFKRDLKVHFASQMAAMLGWNGHAAPKAKSTSALKRGAVLAQYVKHSFGLRATVKGRTIKARVRRNGTIRCGTRIYNSPSQAARAVVKSSCNGWTFWRYQRAPGEWVKLRELKRR